MVEFWYINEKGTFTETRKASLGASDTPSLFPNPEKPTESLAGYKQTAITLYKDKIGETQNYTESLPAEMGHYLEHKSIEIFIRNFFGKKIASELVQNKILFEMKRDNGEDVSARDFQVPLFHHNTEYYYDGMIVHADLIYEGQPDLLDAPRKDRYKTIQGIMVDLAKPFYLESKSATKDATKRHNGTFVKGYDFSLTNWQGIPLKHYVQMQFQGAILEIDTGYLPLMHNTSEYQAWRIDRDKIWQKRIINIVGLMLKCIEDRIMPKELAICQADIIMMYSKLRKDFLNVSGEALDKLKELQGAYHKADQQEKNWKGKKEDAKDALSVHLQDYDEIKDGSDSICKWVNKKGGKRFASSIKDIYKNFPRIARYLERNELIKQDKDSRYIKVSKIKD